MTNLKKHQMAAKDKISQYLHKAKSFCKNHQNEIIVGSYIVLVSGLGITAIKMKRYKNSLDVERKALENSKRDIKIVIRLTGTNEEEGQRILEEAGIPYEISMEKAAKKAVELCNSLKA